MSRPRIVFAGTPEFAVPALRALIESSQRPLAVLTQPDRPAGRGRQLRFSPVKALALEAGLPVLQPRSLRLDEARVALAELEPELIITAAYGLLLPPAVLDLPRHGCWNLHASLLPRWRGASPIQQAILAGDADSGISLMQMDPGLDTGPVLMTRATAIDPEETAGGLHDRLAAIAAPLLIEALGQLQANTLPSAQPQDEALATHAPLIAKDDARLDWSEDAAILARKVRAYHPWPIAFADIAGLSCRIHRARAAAGEGRPGQLLPSPGRDAVRVACGRGVLEILELQAPGRRCLPARDWLNAHPDWA